MKNLKFLAMPALMLALVFSQPALSRSQPAGQNLIPMNQKMTFVSLEKLEAEYIPANRLVAIRGSIKNISKSTMRGYLTVYLLSSGGSVLRAFDLPIKEHRPFADGESVAFDTVVNVSNVSGAYQVSVDFTRD